MSPKHGLGESSEASPKVPPTSGSPAGARDGGDDGSPVLVSSADQLYFRAVEELFVGLRGAPMLLSPADWRVASSWRRRGIPLTIVREALEGVFEKRRERGASRRVNSLRYCAGAVEKAWREVSELGQLAASAEGASGVTATTPVPTLLERLAASLPATLPAVEAWRARVLALVGDAETVEGQLAALDTELLRSLEAELPAAERTVLQEAARAAAARLADRLGSAEVERAARRLGDLRLRQHWGAPVLSLFAPARDRGGEDEPR
jgi:hypothetical protein